MFRKTTAFFALFCTIILSGCVMHMVANSFPTYEETVNSWPELDENHSRIFMFSLDAKAFEIFGRRCEVTLDGVDYVGMFPGTFMFIDIGVGEHTLSCTKSNTPKLTLNTKGGEIIYISQTSPLKVFKIQDIQEQLKVLNHGFDEPLPYDDQPFTIKRRSKE